MNSFEPVSKAVVLNPQVMTPGGGGLGGGWLTYQITCTSGIYITIPNSSQLTVLK